ncbi:hypothetical protein IT407_02255 [Candidatus Uhrbacteria bacterium]|nr:hypothetical protein [Candidatus Uhrbacteria bacterium]
MISWSRSYILQGATRNWFVGIVFFLVGIGFGIGGFFIPLEPADEIARWALWFMAAVFGFIGAAILLMMIRGGNIQDISTIGGLMGALAYGLPSTFALPVLYLLYQSRPNAVYASDAVFDTEQWVLGSVFSLTGIFVTLASIALARYQLRTGKSGWNWSWTSDGGVKQDDSDSESS